MHKGRVITPKGASLLDKIAAQISKGKPKKEDDKKAKEPVNPKAPKVQEAAKEEIAVKNG